MAIRSARARQTGRLVEWGRASDFGMADDDGKWCTVCVDHGAIVHHDTAALARSWAVEPKTWCEECRDAGQERLTRAEEM